MRQNIPPAVWSIQQVTKEAEIEKKEAQVNLVLSQSGHVAQELRILTTKISHYCPHVACKHSVNTVSAAVCLMLSILGPLVQ